ncbi:MAG: hypothetical protein ABGZ53_34545, partial [Fuerstiella sp.]
MLSAKFVLDTSAGTLDVTLDDDDPKVYFRTDDLNVLQYSTDEMNWSSDVDNDGTSDDVTLNHPFTITVSADDGNGSVHLVGIQTQGTDLTVTSAVDLSVVGDLNTVDGNTRGAITLKVSDQDKFFSGGGGESKIMIGATTPPTSDADLDGDGRVTVTAGEVTITATQTEKKSQRWAFGKDSITATIDITDSDIFGDSVTITAQSKDLSYGDEQPWYGNYVQPIVVDTVVDGLLGGGSFISLFLRKAASYVTIDGSDIRSTELLRVESLNTTNASATAIAARPPWLDRDPKSKDPMGIQGENRALYALNTLSFGLTKATGTAKIEIIGTSSLESVSGNVEVEANATVTSSVTARTTNNINDASPAHEGGGSFGITLSDTTVTATLGEQASIAAPSGSVNFEALGTVTNTGSATSSSYKDGTAGLTVAVGSDTTTVTTTVDGDIQSGGTVTKTQSFATADIGPDPDDVARINTLTIPGHGFVDGQTVDFRVNSSSGDTPSIGDLVDGESLRVRVLNENSIQLYLTEEIDLRSPDGNSTSEQTFSLYDTWEFNPQTQDLTGDWITLSGHPFETEQEVRYSVRPPTDEKPSEPIGGLYDGTTYYVIVDELNPDRFQLALSAADASDGQQVTLTGPGEGTQHSFDYVSESRSFLPATDLDDEANTISIITSGVETGDPLLYQTDPNIQTPPLVIERNYGFTPEGITSSFDATGTVSFDQAVLDPTVFVLTIPHHGWQTEDSVVYSVADENGETSLPILVGDDSELTDGESYQVIRVDDHTIQLALPESPAPATALELVDGSESGIQQLSGPGQSHFFDPAGTVEWQTVDTIQNSVLFEAPHGLVTGQRVTYSPGQSASGQPNSSIGGLVADKDYYVITISDYEIQLSLDRIDNPQRDVFDGLVSVDDGAIGLSSGATGATDSLHQFFGHTVDPLNDWIISQNHELETGQAVTYNAGDGTAIGGLTDGMTYYAIRLDGNTIRLADSLEDASRVSVAPGPAGNVVDQSQLLATEGGFSDHLFQSFQPDHNNITGASVRKGEGPYGGIPADITIGLYDKLPAYNSELAYDQLSAFDENLLATGTAFNVPVGEWAVVDFGAQIPVIPNTTYYLLMWSSVKWSSEVRELNHYYGTIEDSYPRGQIFVSSDGTASDHDLAFQTFTADSENASYLPLDSAGTGTLQALTTDSFVFPVEASRTESVVDTTANTIELVGHGLTDGQKVNYQTSGGDAIGGLEDNQLYGVLVVDENHIQLTQLQDVDYADVTTPVGEPLSLNAGATLGTGLHVFRILAEVELYNREDPILVFDPTVVEPVDTAADQIRVLGHGLSTGDSVHYITGGGNPIGGLVNGTEYFAIPVTDSAGNETPWLKLAASQTDAENNAHMDLRLGASGDRHGIQVASIATQSDLPIVGLGNAVTYYAIVDGPNTLRLAESPQEAFGAVAQDLTPSASATQSSYMVVATDDFDGILVSASLTAKNTQNAGTLVGSSPTLSDFITKPEVIGRRFYNNNKLLPDYRSPDLPKLKTYSEKSGSFVAGVAVNLVDHSVSVTVGSTDTEPVLTSATDVRVAADITQKVQTKAQGNAVTAPGRKYVFSAGFAWSNVEDTALATVGNQASVDAPGTLDVTSNITYPLLVSKHDLIPFSDCHDDDNANTACHPLKDISTYLDGSFGLSRVLNTWANSKAFTPKREQTYDNDSHIKLEYEDDTKTKKSLPKAAFTFSIGTGQYTNESHAIIRSGARINQSSIDAGNSQVNVLADTNIRLVGLAGIMHLRLNEDAAAKAIINRNKDFNSLGNAFSLTANKSESFGLGFSYMEQILTDITVATIESGALVSSGRNSKPEDEEYGQGVTVKATEFAKTFNFSQSGADSEGGGVAGSVGITRHQDSFTVASVDDGVVVDSEGKLTITAESEALHSVGVGGVVFGETVGVGLSAGVVVTDRHTGAFLGASPDDWTYTTEAPSTGTPVANPLIDVSDLVLDAKNKGQQTTVSVVGSVAKGSNRASGAWSKKAEDKGFKTNPTANSSHLGFAGDTAVNVADEQTLALVDFSGNLEVTGSVDMGAWNTTDFFAVSGAAAIAWNGEGSQKVSVAMTAAIAWNELALTTESSLGGRATLEDTRWSFGSLD